MWTDTDELELHLEYAKLITDYRNLSGQPISFADFRAMTEMAVRLEDIRSKLQTRQPATVAAPERSLTL